MGLLDDAIREHLDLKRRRGADPADIERAEHEALGPVRRKGGGEPATAEAELDELIEVDEQEHLDPDGYEESIDDEPAAGVEEPSAGHAADLAAHDALMRDDDAIEDDAADPPAPPVGDEPDEPFAEDEHATRVMRIPPTPSAEPSRDREDDTGGETTEYDVEEYLASEEQGKGAGDEDEDEDVLEETPEFLQDTPDHDRLWFEQRPPRDFDFDG